MKFINFRLLLILCFLITGCKEKVVIPVPENFCPSKIRLKTHLVNIFSVDYTSDPVFKKIHLEKQAKQWAIDRFSSSNTLTDESIKIEMQVYGTKIKKQKVSFFSNNTLNEYVINIHCSCCKVDTNGNTSVFFEIRESGSLSLENVDDIDEVHSLNDIVGKILRKIDYNVTKKMKSLNWIE